MQIYSQRDDGWKNDKMGTGTLGQFGCTVTCLSMLSGIEPGVLNNEIKSINGYSGNYLIWDKLDSIKGFDFIKRVKSYNNDDVAANLPCLVEVDGSPIGGVTHWVLYVGNHKCFDPWDGKEKSTSTYRPMGYAVVKYVSPLTPTESEVVSSPQAKILIGLLNTGTAYEHDYGIGELQAVGSIIADKDRKIFDLEQQNINLRNALQIANKPTTVYVEQTAPEDPPVGSGKPTVDVSSVSPLTRLWTVILNVFKSGKNDKTQD